MAVAVEHDRTVPKAGQTTDAFAGEGLAILRVHSNNMAIWQKRGGRAAELDPEVASAPVPVEVIHDITRKIASTRVTWSAMPTALDGTGIVAGVLMAKTSEHNLGVADFVQHR